MAATYSYQQIIDSIDDALYTFCQYNKPVSVTVEGNTRTYRSLSELQSARNYYANLLRTQSGGAGFQLTNLKHGGPTG